MLLNANPLIYKAILLYIYILYCTLFTHLFTVNLLDQWRSRL